MARGDLPDPCEIIPACPVCLSDQLVFAIRTGNVDICVCKKCGTSLSVPHDAWDMREPIKSDAGK